MEMRLDELKRGQRGQITRVVPGTKAMAQLMEMGATPGATVELTRRAPLGDPIEIELRGYRLTLRRADARNIRIRWEA